MDRVTLASAAAVVVIATAAAVPVYQSATAAEAQPVRPAASSAAPAAPSPSVSPAAPASATPTPTPTPEATRAPVTPSQDPAPTKAPAKAAKPSSAAPAPRTTAPKPKPESRTVISSYAVCQSNPQPCIDRGSLTLYGSDYGPGILAGHNYDGFQWLSRLPVGRKVVVTSGAVAGTYEVTGHMRLNRQSGSLPSFGGADLVLQSCEGSGTGFSLLRLISR